MAAHSQGFPMRVTIIGGGYVGLVSGACLAELGHAVAIVETMPERISMLRRGLVPIFEPGLASIMAANTETGRLRFTDDTKDGLDGAEVAAICVGTPPLPNGQADVSQVLAAARQIARHAGNSLTIVTKSTVPVGTGAAIQRAIDGQSNFPVHVASNPEFLREGCAVEDFMNPDRIVIGTDGGPALATLRKLYVPLTTKGAPLLAVSVATAEMAKYAANAFLAAKVAFINEVADLCEATGADVQEVSEAMGLDSRIGSRFLRAGPGYGGSCFPKDTCALAHMAQEAARPMRIVEATIASNEARKAGLAQRVIDACGGSVQDKTIAILGLAFKADTDDMRDSAAIDCVNALVMAGARIQAYDPKAMPNARKLLPPSVLYRRDAFDAAHLADAVVVLTEWSEFRDIHPNALEQVMQGRVAVDFRNIWNPDLMRCAGFDYSSVGRRH